MKRLIITEEEKQRILEMHESATKRNYLSEQSTQPAATATAPKTSAKKTIVTQITPNQFGLDNKTAPSFITLARANTQFVFKGVYYALRRRGELPKEPMNWNERNLSWELYGFDISTGYPFFESYYQSNILFVNNIITTGPEANSTDKCEIKYMYPEKSFRTPNRESLVINGVPYVLNSLISNLNGMVGREKINTVKMTEYLNTLITQESYNSAFKKVWLPTLNPTSSIDSSDIKNIQSSWFYGWLKSKYGSSQPTGAQPTGTTPTGTTPAR
jgi:hypothetical protein